MATDNKKIKDFFNPITNPSGGFNTGGQRISSISRLLTGSGTVPASAPVDRSKLTVGPGTSVSQAFSGSAAPASNKMMAGWSMRPDGSLVAPRGPAPSATPAPASALGGQGGYSPESAAPVAPMTQAPIGQPPVAPETPVTNPETTQTPAQWMNPDGTMKDPTQIASEVASRLQAGSGQGDVGTLAGNEFSDANKTEEQLRAEAALVTNARNDISTGASDPFGVAGESGIAYTPAELQAIESAYAGVYDPAIVTAQAKLEAKQAENIATREAEVENTQAERDFQNDLTMLGKKHDYDLDKMKNDQDFQKSLASYKASLSAAAAARAGAGAASGGMSPYTQERALRAVNSIDSLMSDVNNWTVGFGSLLSNLPSTDALNFRTRLDTLKSSIAFNELTAMREASKTGGALGNVSNIELNLLESALAGLDQAQSAEDFRTELTKAKESINRWVQAGGGQYLGTPTPGQNETAPAVGATMDIDGATYRSDGNQWVLVE